MKSITQLWFMRALSPLHVGSGSEIGIVDLPIQREKHTQFPKIDSSSFKGALRSHYYGKWEEQNKLYNVFGSDAGAKDGAQAGAISTSDCRTLLFPVKSMKGVFGYVTCPYVLDRFNREMAAYGLALRLPVPDLSEGDVAVSSDKLLITRKVVLEEFVYAAKQSSDVTELASRIAKYFDADPSITDRIIVVSDDEFKQFVELSTEVNARIRINEETGTVTDGALFYEENVPVETLMYTLFHIGETKSIQDGKREHLGYPAERVKQELNQSFPNVLQVGGNATLGRGMMQIVSAEEVLV